MRQACRDLPMPRSKKLDDVIDRFVQQVHRRIKGSGRPSAPSKEFIALKPEAVPALIAV